MLGSAGTPACCIRTGELQYLLAFLHYAGGDSIRGSLAHSCGGHLPSNAAEDLDRGLFERLMGTHPRRLRSAVHRWEEGVSPPTGAPAIWSGSRTPSVRGIQWTYLQACYDHDEVEDGPLPSEWPDVPAEHLGEDPDYDRGGVDVHAADRELATYDDAPAAADEDEEDSPDEASDDDAPAAAEEDEEDSPDDASDDDAPAATDEDEEDSPDDASDDAPAAADEDEEEDPWLAFEADQEAYGPPPWQGLHSSLWNYVSRDADTWEGSPWGRETHPTYPSWHVVAGAVDTPLSESDDEETDGYHQSRYATTQGRISRRRARLEDFDEWGLPMLRSDFDEHGRLRSGRGGTSDDSDEETSGDDARGAYLTSVRGFRPFAR